MKKLKIALIAAGMGMGLASSVATAESCRNLWKLCDWEGQAWACTQYLRQCGQLP